MRSIRDVLPEVLRNLQSPEAKKKSDFFDQWEKVVGKKFSGLTKPSLTKNGELFVWVRDSALAFELNQKFKPVILKRAKALLGEGQIKGIHIRVGQLR
jgi:hypothetical protein